MPDRGTSREADDDDKSRVYGGHDRRTTGAGQSRGGRVVTQAQRHIVVRTFYVIASLSGLVGGRAAYVVAFVRPVPARSEMVDMLLLITAVSGLAVALGSWVAARYVRAGAEQGGIPRRNT